MASPAGEASPTVDCSSPPGFEQHRHEQRPPAPPLSPGESLSAPHSTVDEAAEVTPGTNLVPSSPDSGFSCSPVVGSAAPVWPARRTSHGARRSSAPDARKDDCESERKRGDATAVVIVDPEVSRLNVDVDVEAGSSTVVRWICRGAEEGGEGAGDGREALAFSDGSGRRVDGQSQQQEAEGGREGTEEPAPSGSPSSANLTVTVVSDEVDEPQVTCQVPPGGGCCEKIFDRPGSYTYYVCSGPLTMGRVVATAPKCQAQSAAIAVDCPPAAGVKDSDTGKQGVDDIAVSEATPAKSDTAVGGHSSEVCASQDERECRSAAQECGPEAVEASDSPGQDQNHDFSHAAVEVDTLSDAKQAPPEGAEILTLSSQDSLAGGPCVDAVLPGVEGGADKDVGEEPGAQSSCDHGASESRLEEEQAPNHPSPSGLLTLGERNSERLLLQEADQGEYSANHSSSIVPLLPCPRLPVSPGGGSSERLPLQGPGQEGSSLTGVPEINGGGNGSRNQSPISAVVTSVGSTQRVGDCKRDEGAGCRRGVEVRNAAHRRREIGNGVELYISSESDADQTITPQSNSPASIRRGTDDDVISQPLGERGGSRLSQLAVSDEGGPYQGLAVYERTTECPSDNFPTQHLQELLTPENAEGILPRTGGGSSSYGSDDVPRASCVGDSDNPNAGKSKGLCEQPSSPVSPSTSVLVLPTTDTPDRSRGGTSFRPAGSATATQPQRSPQGGCIGRHRVEVMQRDGAGQEWKEISPLTSPAAVAGPGGIFGPFACSEDTVPSPPPIMSDYGRKEQGSEDTVETVHGVDEEEEEATPSILEEATVVVAALLPEVGNKSKGITQAAMEALDVSDGDSLVIASCAISPSTASPMAAADSVGHVPPGSPDEAAAETSPAPNEAKGTMRTAMEGLVVSDDENAVKALRAMFSSTAPPAKAADSIDDVLSGSADEAAAGTDAAPIESEGPVQPAVEAPNDSDGNGSIKSSQFRSPTSAVPAGAEVNIGHVSSDSANEAAAGSADETAAKTGAAPASPAKGDTPHSLVGSTVNAYENEADQCCKALDRSDGEYSVKASRTAPASTAPPVVAESVGNAWSGSADEAAAETGTAPDESEGAMPTAMKALDVSDDDGSVKASRATSPSTTTAGVAENIGDVSSSAADEATLGTDTAPDESTGAIQTAMEALDVSHGDGSPKASGGVSPPATPPVGAEKTIGDVSSGSAEAVAETGAAPDESEGAMQTTIEALDVSDGDGPVKASRAISPSTAPPAEAEENTADVWSGSADEAAADTSMAPVEAVDVSDGDDPAKASRAMPPVTVPPVEAEEKNGDVLSDSADEGVSEIGTALNGSEGAMQTALEALDVSDGDASAKASRAISPSTAPPARVGTILDVSPCSINEAASETGTAPNEPKGQVPPAIEALDVSDGDGSVKAWRAIFPSTAPLVGAADSIGDVSSGCADEAAAETGTAPDESEGTMQTAVEELDVSDGDDSVKASHSIFPSTLPPPGAEENIRDVSSYSADEAAAETGMAPDESEGAMQAAVEARDVLDGDGPAKASRAISPSAEPQAGAEENNGDISSGSTDEAASEPGTAPTYPANGDLPRLPTGSTMNADANKIEQCYEALDVSDCEYFVEASCKVSPSTAPPVVAEESIGDASSISVDTAAAETSTTPDESEGVMQTEIEALDVSDGDGSVKASRTIFPSRVPAMGAAEDVGDVSSSSANEAAAETDASPDEEPESAMQTAMEALDVSDGDGSAKASRAIPPSMAPLVGVAESIGDAVSGSANEVAVETVIAPDYSERASQTEMKALHVPGGDGPAKAPRAIAHSTTPPAGVEKIVGISPCSADEAAAETDTAPDGSEGAMQAAMKALDVSNSVESAKASRAMSPSIAPSMGVDNVGDVSFGSADEAAAETGKAPDESEGSMHTVMEAFDVADDGSSAKASLAISPWTAPPVLVDSVGNVPLGCADEAAAGTGTTPVESEGVMQIPISFLGVSDGDGSVKASRAMSPSIAPPVGVENIVDVSFGSADRAAAETSTAPDKSEGKTLAAMEGHGVSNGDASVKASRAISPMTAPPAGIENIGDVSSSATDEAAGETGATPDESNGAMQSAMKTFDVSDSDGPVKASGAIFLPAAAPAGVESIGDASSGSAYEAVAETGTAPDESEGALQAAIEAHDVSDGDGSVKNSRAISPSTAPPAGVEDIGDATSGSADEAAPETGTAPDESESTLQTAIEAHDVRSVKASRTISPSTAPPAGAENIGGGTSGSADETAAETGTASDESKRAMQTAMTAPDVADGDGLDKASREIFHSTAPRVGVENVDNVSSVSADEAPAETDAALVDRSEGAMQTAMATLDVSDGDGSLKASRTTSASAVPPVGATHSIGDVSFGSADEAVAETLTAPGESEEAMQTAVEEANVADGEGSVKAAGNIGDVSSDYDDEAAAETGTAPDEPEDAMQTAVETLHGLVKISRAVPSSTAPQVSAAESIGNASFGSADETAVESATGPYESEGAVQTAMEALDGSDGNGSVMASRAISPSTTPPVGVAESIGDVLSRSADEAAAETGTAPDESVGAWQTEMEALDVSDDDGSAKAPRAISPSTPPPAEVENIIDVSTCSADEASAEADTAPDESEGAMQTAVEALDGSVKISRAVSSSIAPPVGSAENIDNASSCYAVEGAAERATAPDESESAVQTVMEALDRSDGDGSVKASRAISPSTAPPVGSEESIDDVSSCSADEAAAETGMAHDESEGAWQNEIEGLDVSDDDGSAKASRAISPSAAPPVTAESIGDVYFDPADETAAETGMAPDDLKSAMQSAMETLGISNGQGSVKALRAMSPSSAPSMAAESIDVVSSGSADEAAPKTSTAPDESKDSVQTATEELDVSDGGGSVTASRAIYLSKAPLVGAENTGDMPAGSADEAAATIGAAPVDSECLVQTAMEPLDVTDGDSLAKASHAILPSTSPPMGSGENIGDISSGSADEAAAETGTAPDDSESATHTVMKALDFSDSDGPVKVSRATPSTTPPLEAAGSIIDAFSGSADESAVEKGTAPDETESPIQTAVETPNDPYSEDTVKASHATSLATAPAARVEENVGDVSSGSADEAAVETGTAPVSPADGDLPRLPTGSTVNADVREDDQCCEVLGVSDGQHSAKTSRAISPSTAPPVKAAENVGDVSSGFADEAAAETGIAPASSSPASLTKGGLPLLPIRPTVSIDASGGDQCCESIVGPLSCAAVETSDVAPANSKNKTSPAKSNVKSDVECDGDCIYTMVVRADSMQPFDPEVVRIPVGARVMWKQCSGATSDDEPEIFNVRQGCPIVETGWRTEFSFSIGGDQPTFVANFKRAGRFVISSDASPPGADRKRGEVIVGNDAGHSDSDSFASPDDVQTSSEGFASGNEGNSRTPGSDTEGGFGIASPRLAPLSLTGSERAPQDFILNSCGSLASDGDERRDCDEQNLVAASLSESSGDLNDDSATAEPGLVHNCVAPSRVSSGVVIPPCAAVTGTEAKTVERPFPTMRRPRSFPPHLGAHGMSDGGRSSLSDGRGWVPPNRLSVLEWSKGSHIADESQRSPVAAASRECLRSSRLLHDTHAPAALPLVSGREPSRGGGGKGGEGRGVGADSGSDCGLSDTNVDGNRESLTIVNVHVNEVPAEASAQVDESFPSVSSACTPLAAPDAKDGLPEPSQLAPEACETVQVDHEEYDVVAASSVRFQEDEITAQLLPKTAQSKKKKAKKKKKKSGGGVGGGDRGGDGGGGRTTSGSNVYPSSRVSVGEDNSAMLLDEDTFSELFGDGTTGVGLGSGKTVAKTLIVGDQGFKPWKPVLVQVGATVSIKAANVWPNGGIGQDRALSISLVGPVVHNAETKRFFEGSNKAEDMPDPSKFKKSAPSGKALVAVFRKRGEYWLVDHLAGKRIKVTAVARETAPVAYVEPGQPTLSGKQDSASLSQGTDSAEATQRRGGNSGGEVTSRSKKKNRGNDKSSEAPSLVKEIDAKTVEDPAVILKLAEVVGSTGVPELAHDADLSTSNTRGVVDGGNVKMTTATSTSTVADDLLEQARERALSPRLLPPVRVMLERDLSLDDFAWFTKFDAVHVVRVSYRKGFEPATLEMGLSPGLGALVVCELDMKLRVTREVFCRWRPDGAGDASGTTQELEEVDAGTASRAVARGEDVETHSPMELATRLGPGCLKKCHFVLGRFGEYQVSFRDDIEMGLAVVVKPPKASVASPVSTSAFNTGAESEAGLGADSVNSSSQVQPLEGQRSRRLRDQKPETVEHNSSSEAAGEDGNPDSTEAPSDEDSANVSGSTTSSAEISSLEKGTIDKSGVASTQVLQDVAGGKSGGVAAVEGDGFCWEDAMADRDQGDFVQQRSHVKRIKRHKIKSEKAEAAKNAAVAAALLAAAAATAEAAAAATVVTKPPHSEEAALASKSVVPTGPSAPETGMPTVTAPPADKPTLEESRTAETSTREEKRDETSSQRVTATDKSTSSVNSCLDEKPQKSPVVLAKASGEVSASPGFAVVNADPRSSLTGESGGVEATAAKPAPLGRRKGRNHFDGENLDSPRRSAQAERVVIVVAGPSKTQRKREVREDKNGGVRIAASTRHSTCVTSIEPAQDTLVANKIAATATGWGVAISGASWSDDVGPTQSEVRAGVPPEGCNASRTGRAASRPYSQQSLAAPPRVPYRRWDAPRATAFSQPHPPPQSSYGRGWNASNSGGSARPAISNWRGASVNTAPLGSTADHNYSPSSAEAGERHVILKESTGTAPVSVALAPLPTEMPVLAGPAKTLGTPTIADSKENTRVANQPLTYSSQGSGAGSATSSTDAPGVVGVGSLPSTHFVARDRAYDVSHEDGGGYRRSHEEGGGYGRRNRTGTESTRSSSRTSAHSRSGSFSSGPLDPTLLAAGSNAPASSKQKSKKKAKAERKAAHTATAGAVVVGAAFPGELKSSATPEPSAGQLHVTSSKPMARSGKARKSDSQGGFSSRSGLSFGDFVLPAKSAAGRACGGFGPSTSGRRDAATARPPAAVASSESSSRVSAGNGSGVSGEEKNAGAGNGRDGGGGENVGEVKKNTTSGEDAKGGQTSRGRPGPARRAAAGGWGGADAAPVLKSVPVDVLAPPSGRGNRPTRPPPYEQPTERGEDGASEGGTVGNPETLKGAVLSTGAGPSPTAARSPKASDSFSGKPRWGNGSTKISFEERSRRSQVLKGTRLPRGHRREPRGRRPRPAAFPEDSRLPGGGYLVPEGPEDRLPPPSAYEIEESARMMKVYEDMVERLNTTGFDEKLPDGFTPKIYDFTKG